ncbi:MAG: citrate transporter [Clostridia bacterium]|nr:citrate transporter [Clostridia bacterium]
MRILLEFVKKNTVFTIAVIAAVVTSFIIPPDKEYIGYFDFKVLSCLFSVLAVVCALRSMRFFYSTAQKIVKRFDTARNCVIALVYITFIGSMLIANDMALITFLPLGYYVLKSTDSRKYMAFLFIMQNIAANLGGMLTPFGNPQNLYLYTKFHIPTGEFVEIMFAPFILSVVLMTVCCFIFVGNEHLKITVEENPLDPKRVALYLVLFAISVIMVFRVLPYYIGLIVIFVVLIFENPKALKKVDYPLLGTFAAFFIFSGNMARIDAVKELFAYLLDKSTLLFSILSCQVISNVPSAILLSQFTENYRDLLVGVNIGGVGTLISSLASLITFREYTKHNPGKGGKYLLMFSAFNFLFLIILTVFMILIK